MPRAPVLLALLALTLAQVPFAPCHCGAGCAPVPALATPSLCPDPAGHAHHDACPAHGCGGSPSAPADDDHGRHGGPIVLAFVAGAGGDAAGAVAGPAVRPDLAGVLPTEVARGGGERRASTAGPPEHGAGALLSADLIASVRLLR